MYDDLIQRLHRYTENYVAYKLDADFASAVQEAADAIEELQKQLQKSEEDNVNLTGWLAEEHAKHLWIPVTERLPDYDEDVLVYANGLLRVWDRIKTLDDVDYWEDEYGHWGDFNDVDYWMPLPEPPKEET